MNENEAKTKWCPFVRFQPIGNDGNAQKNAGCGNRVGGTVEEEPLLNPSTCRCIASQCMAWRWGYEIDDKKTKEGYCGLAGEPCNSSQTERTDKPNIIRLPTVEAITGLSRSTIYARTANGTFPAPIKLSARAVGWLHGEIEEWLSKQINNRNSR